MTYTVIPRFTPMTQTTRYLGRDVGGKDTNDLCNERRNSKKRREQNNRKRISAGIVQLQ